MVDNSKPQMIELKVRRPIFASIAYHWDDEMERLCMRSEDRNGEFDHLTAKRATLKNM